MATYKLQEYWSVSKNCTIEGNDSPDSLDAGMAKRVPSLKWNYNNIHKDCFALALLKEEPEIRLIAYRICEEEGCCHGRDIEHW